MVEDRVWRPSEILERYRNGDREFRELEITGRDDDQFRNAVLDGANFAGAFIVAEFTNASLRGCCFAANVKTCTFDGADLEGSTFAGANLEAATFEGALLHDVTFEGAHCFSHTFGPGELPD